MSTSEEARAALYREQQTRRAEFRLQLETSLRGSQAAYDELVQEWAPLLSDPGWDPPDEGEDD